VLQLPPLRELKEDVLALARYFLGRIGDQPGLRPLGITDGALSLLAAYDLQGQPPDALLQIGRHQFSLSRGRRSSKRSNRCQM
jgi:hypothetical protein